MSSAATVSNRTAKVFEYCRPAGAASMPKAESAPARAGTKARRISKASARAQT